MTTVAIMQPTYLPWVGYFDLLDQADVFVLLDNVPISRQSWQTRNRIRGRDGNVIWLSVPVHAGLGQPLNEVRIADEHDWAEKHARTIEAAYEHASHYGMLALRITGFEYLTELNEFWIRLIANRVGIDTTIIRASSLARQSHGRLERLADILQSCGADEFLQTAGGRENLGGITDIEGTPIRYHEYEHPVYDQGGAEFMPHLSVVDLLAWHGPDSLDIIRTGRRLVTKTGNG